MKHILPAPESVVKNISCPVAKLTGMFIPEEPEVPFIRSREN